jgi:hypothetical protein
MKQITKTELTNLVNQGKKKDEIATYYGLNVAETGRLLKQAGLTIKKVRKPTFTFVDDTNTTSNDVNTVKNITA